MLSFKAILLAVVVVIALLVFHFRGCLKTYFVDNRPKWLHRLQNHRYMRLGDEANANSFEDDVRAGLTSSNFDLEANINDATDTRKGLSESAKSAIRSLMSTKGLSFDGARLEYMRLHMAENDIDSEGVPRDPKLVRFD